MRFIPTLRRPDFVDSTTEAVMRVARRAITSTTTPGSSAHDDVRLPENLQYPPSRRTRRLIRTAKSGG